MHCQFGQQPADGSGECNVGGVPAHGFVKFDASHEFGQRLQQHFVGAPAGFSDHGDHILTAVDLLDLQVTDADTPALGKTLSGTGGLSRGIKGAAGRGTFDHGGAIHLAIGKVFDPCHQPPGSAQDGHLAVSQP